MLKRICDRCGSDMELDTFPSQAKDTVISETQNGSVTRILDICPKCMLSFKYWLHNQNDANGTVAPINLLSSDDKHRFYLCRCRSLLLYGQKYCSTCGKKVDWDHVVQTDQ